MTCVRWNMHAVWYSRFKTTCCCASRAVTGNGLEADGGIAVAAALERNSTLTQLDLSRMCQPVSFVCGRRTLGTELE